MQKRKLSLDKAVSVPVGTIGEVEEIAALLVGLYHGYSNLKTKPVFLGR